MSSKPYFEKHVFFCLNQRAEGEACCQQFAATEQFDHMKKRVKALGLAGEGGIRVNKAGCLDRCAQGPVLVVYPEGVWYQYVDKEDIDEIIDEHLQHGRVVERLTL
jgi:(2Fe-2S) ferredoxin